MHRHATPTTPDDLSTIDPDAVRDEYDRRNLATVDDQSLLRLAARVVAEPRASVADSFILHAPLEVLARASLLPHCSPQVRESARQRLVWTAATYAVADAPADLDHGSSTRIVDDAGDADSLSAVADRLVDAIAAGALDDAARLGRWLGARAGADHLTQLLAGHLVASLAAAGHASIFFSLLPRVGARTPAAGSMLGALARELARHPTARIDWIDDGSEPTSPGGGLDLAESVASTPVLGRPESSFILPVMRQAQESGLAPSLARPRPGPVLEQGLALLRVSTESMLLDDPAHTPYGWSHCLTMPQAVVTVAPWTPDPTRALAVAATHVVGFRAALGSSTLTELRGRAPAAPADGFDLADPPRVTAATFRTLPEHERRLAIRRVVDMAAVHHDAHLAKYVVACIDAARADPLGAGQHLAAACHLASWWWDLGPRDGDPLAQDWCDRPSVAVG